MKFLIVFCVVLAVVAADWKPTTKEEFIVDRDACLESEKVSEHCQGQIKKNEFPDEPGCYFRCLGLKVGTWDDATGYNMDRVVETTSANNLAASKEKLDECNGADKKDDDPCKWAANVMKCIWENKVVTKKAV